MTFTAITYKIHVCIQKPSAIICSIYAMAVWKQKDNYCNIKACFKTSFFRAIYFTDNIDPNATFDFEHNYFIINYTHI